MKLCCLLACVLCLPSSAQISLSALGDSIIAAGYPHTQTNTPAMPTAWPTWAVYLSGGKIHMRGNKAIPGAVSASLVPGQTDFIDRMFNLGSKPDLVPIYIGVNDLQMGVAVPTIISNVNRTIDELVKKEIKPVICGIAPYSFISANWGKSESLNTRLKQLALNRGCSFVDFWTVCCAPGTNFWRPGETREGIHPTQIGAKRMGIQFLKALGIQADPAYSSPFLAQSATDPTTCLTNGLFLDRDGNRLPDAWAFYASHGETFSAEPDCSFGNRAVIGKYAQDGEVCLSNVFHIPYIPVGHRVLFAGKASLEVMGSGAGGGATIGCRWIGDIDPNSDSELCVLNHVTNDIPEGAAFSFEGTSIEGSTGAIVTVRMTNMLGVLKISQFKIVDLDAYPVPVSVRSYQGLGGHKFEGNIGIDTVPEPLGSVNKLSINGNLKLAGGLWLGTNSLPSAPIQFGAAFIGNSNGVVYLLTSGFNTLTWTGTNRLAP